MTHLTSALMRPGWTQAGLARRSKISINIISDIINKKASNRTGDKRNIVVRDKSFILPAKQYVRVFKRPLS
jgi:hypothetical protein